VSAQVGHNSVELAMEWLCSHLDEGTAEEGAQPGTSTETVNSEEEKIVTALKDVVGPAGLALAEAGEEPMVVGPLLSVCHYMAYRSQG
jgi:hypothetical protein